MGQHQDKGIQKTGGSSPDGWDEGERDRKDKCKVQRRDRRGVELQKTVRSVLERVGEEKGGDLVNRTICNKDKHQQDNGRDKCCLFKC